MTNSKYLDTDRPTTAEDWLKSLPTMLRAEDSYIQEYRDGKCSLVKLILSLKQLETIVKLAIADCCKEEEKSRLSKGGSESQVVKD